jgi:hypothetical protein
MVARFGSVKADKAHRHAIGFHGVAIDGNKARRWRGASGKGQDQ